jgi:hypothetical protein
MKKARNLKYIALFGLALVILGCPPSTVIIYNPSDNAHFEVGEEISFTGFARDFHDGDLTGDSLVWTSAIDGEIGTGTDFTVDSLSEGTHEITLTATNSQGEESSTSITIVIGEGNDGGANPWVGNWILVNFLADDDEGIWDEDDPSGIGMTAIISDTQWIEKDSDNCEVTYSYTVNADLKYTMQGENVTGTCKPFMPPPKLISDSGYLEFANDNNIMFQYFNLKPGDTILAFKWERR